MNKQILLSQCNGFQWDDGNLSKNWEKHHVHFLECEQIFFNHPLIVSDDEKHSENEIRLLTLGQTNVGRLLFVVFTIREKMIRVISAKDMNPKERKVYRSYGKENS